MKSWCRLFNLEFQEVYLQKGVYVLDFLDDFVGFKECYGVHIDTSKTRNMITLPTEAKKFVAK
jgi:hypothetical protein